MHKFIISAALVPFLLLLAMTMNGCSSTSPYVPPGTNPPGPNPPPANAPLGAFIEDIGTSRNMYTASNDGTGLTKVNSRDFHSVYVLPDGSKGVFAAHAADGYSQIYYLAPVDSTTEPIQLTSSRVDKTSVMLSADGSKIVFLQLNPLETNPDGGPVWDVAVMDADGNNLYVIPRPEGWYVSHPFFSPDGGTIAVTLDQGVWSDMGVFTMKADGSELTRLTPGGANGILALTPAFSPNGQQVAFSSIGWNDVSIYTINTDGSGVQRVGPRDSGWGDPLFAGDRIMFVAQSEMYSVKPDGTDVRRITNNSYEDGFELSIE